jgi:hypothetical protein
MAVSFTLTFASRPRSRMRSSRCTYCRPGVARLALVRHALAEQVERGRGALGVERDHGVERLLDRLAGDEARREVLREALWRTKSKMRCWFDR